MHPRDAARCPLSYNLPVRQCLTLALIIAASLTAQAVRAHEGPADWVVATKLARLTLGSEQLATELTILGRLAESQDIYPWGQVQYIAGTYCVPSIPVGLHRVPEERNQGTTPGIITRLNPLRGP